MLVDLNGKKVEICAGMFFWYCQATQAFCINGGVAGRPHWYNELHHFGPDDKFLVPRLSDYQAVRVMRLMAMTAGFEYEIRKNSKGETIVTFL